MKRHKTKILYQSTLSKTFFGKPKFSKKRVIIIIFQAGKEAISSIREFIHAVVNGFTVGPKHTQVTLFLTSYITN